MVGIAEISGALASINAAKTILQGLTSVRDTTLLNEAKIGLQSALLDAQGGLFAAQQEQSAAADREAKLEQEIVRLKDWSAERDRYELVDVSNGSSFAYMQKVGMRDAQPPHWLCANCFTVGKKSILQRRAMEGRPAERPWDCATCRTAIAASWTRKPEYIDAG